AMHGLETTPDRVEKYLFTRPYYLSKLQFVTRAGDQRFDPLQFAADLHTIEVGTLEDTAAQRFLDKLRIKRKLYTDQVGPYRDLKLGRTDGVLLDLPIAKYFADHDPALQFTGQPMEPGYYAIAVAKKNPRLVEELNVALEHIYKSGELRRIYEHWGLWNEDQQSYWRERQKDPDVERQQTL